MFPYLRISLVGTTQPDVTGDAALDRTCRLLLVPVFLFLVGFFWFASRHRFIDIDEGYYLLASRLVLQQHKVPYLDFFYQQAPLLPYAYGLWMKLFGISWFSARSFSATLTITVGLLLYEHVCHETRRWAAGLSAVALYASSTFIFGWFPIAKTFSLATVFLFGTYVIIARLTTASPPWLVAVAGLLFGLSVDTRSYVVGLAPIFLWWVFRYSESSNRIARIRWFLGGFTIGCVPSLWLFVASPERFLFNNLGYHALRSVHGPFGGWGWKLRIARVLLFGVPGSRPMGSDLHAGNGFQFSLLWAVSFAGILVLRMRRGPALLAFMIAFGLGVISFLPNPALMQYFSMCVPFLIVAAVCAASDYVASLGGARPKRIAVLASVVLLAAFVASSVPSFRVYLITGPEVARGLKVEAFYRSPEVYAWTLDMVNAVSEAIDQVAAPNERIASFWPGYFFASRADPYPGFENNHGWYITQKLTVEQRAKYHIITFSDMEAGFEAHTPRIAVFERTKTDPLDPGIVFSKILLSNGYTELRTTGDVSIFVCCSTRRPQ